MAHYKFVHHRPGESFHTPVGRVQTNEDDGAAELSAEQVEFFKKTGVKLEKVATAPKPREEQRVMDARARREIIENAAAAAAVNAETNRVPIPTAK